jgi:3-(3-hydroxy-phenyl)propionate hydroxylase
VISVGDRPGATLADTHGLLKRRYDALPGSTFLFRPDQHLCARWRGFDVERVLAGVARASMTAPACSSSPGHVPVPTTGPYLDAAA